MFTLCHLLLDDVQFTLIHGPNIPGSYAILFFTALDFTFTTRHIHNWASFLLWPSYFILSGAISNCRPHFPSSILDTFQPGELNFQCLIFLPFILFTKFSQQEYWGTLPFASSVDHMVNVKKRKKEKSYVWEKQSNRKTGKKQEQFAEKAIMLYIWCWILVLHGSLEAGLAGLDGACSPGLWCGVEQGFPGGLEGKESACNVGDSGSILGLGRSPGELNGDPLHCSCLENPMDRGAWQATYSPWGLKSRTQFRD